MKNDDRWYFAYGSNLSVDRKEMRTGAIREAHIVKLPQYRLAFNKRASNGGVYANIMPDPNRDVWGVAYLCNPDAIRELDRFEGVHGGHYEHMQVFVVSNDDSQREALTYVAGLDHVVDDGIPAPEYLGYILSGAREHRLPEEYAQWVEQIGTLGVVNSN